MNWPTIIFDEQENCWWTPVQCDSCGGYRHDLPICSPSLEDGALLQAESVQLKKDSEGCMSCNIADMRANDDLQEGNSIFWYDVRARHWMSWNPVDGIEGGITMPLGIRFPASVEEADVAARMMMGENPIPLAIVEPGLAIDEDMASLYRGEYGEHKLWLPCEHCDGLHMNLEATASDLLEDAAREALQCLSWLQNDGCPACTTALARSEDAEDAPVLWYDTVMNDWTMRLTDSNGNYFFAALGFGYFGVEDDEIIQAADTMLTRLSKQQPRI